MSLVLEHSGGAKIKTRYFPGVFPDESPAHGVTLYGGELFASVDMGIAVDSIRRILGDPILNEEMSIIATRAYVADLQPVNDPAGAAYLRQANSVFFREAVQSSDAQRPVELLGNRIDPQDFVRLVGYVMQNTRLQVPDLEGVDPRLALVEEMRSDI
jgi:hypothetical protein